jgi:hypothetical protein
MTRRGKREGKMVGSHEGKETVIPRRGRVNFHLDERLIFRLSLPPSSHRRRLHRATVGGPWTARTPPLPPLLVVLRSFSRVRMVASSNLSHRT